MERTPTEWSEMKREKQQSDGPLTNFHSFWFGRYFFFLLLHSISNLSRTFPLSFPLIIFLLSPLEKTSKFQLLCFEIIISPTATSSHRLEKFYGCATYERLGNEIESNQKIFPILFSEFGIEIEGVFSLGFVMLFQLQATMKFPKKKERSGKSNKNFKSEISSWGKVEEDETKEPKNWN